MSGDIEKLAVFDSRIVQSRPKFAVEKGALSLTNAPFNAIAATSSQHTYNIYVPSENVFVDRKLLWSSTVSMSMNVALASLPSGGDSIAVPGRDFALTALPLNSLCSTLSATINDTTSVINSQDVLKEVLRLTDYKKNRLVRTAPTMLDKYQNYNDAFGTLANPIGGYDGMTDYDNVPNGSFPNLFFTTSAGVPLATAASVVTPAFAGAAYSSVGGVPTAAPAWDVAAAYPVGSIVQSAGSVWSAVAPVVGTAPAAAAWTNLGSALSYTLYFRWRSTEPLVLSPFVFADECEWDTGLFGINNIQLIMNFQTSPARIIRGTARAGRSISGVAYNTLVAGGNVFTDSVVNAQFLTPSLAVPLPPKSVVPYMEFPRYITQYQNGSIAPGAEGQIISQTITLPSIPDLLIIYAKPSNVGQNDADFYMPLASSDGGGGSTRNPLSINFDNFSGLLSSTTTEQLYNMSVKNGLDMDYATFLGVSHSAAGSYPAITSGVPLPGGAPGTTYSYAARAQGQRIPLVGSILVLKPSQDITLQNGQAPSLVGNFTLQFNLTVKNTSDLPQVPQLYVVTANSGFFESIRGSSRIIKGVLSEQDIIAAPLAPMAVRSELDRIVGGFSFPNFGNILSKAKDIYQSTKPLVSAVRGMLPEEGALGKVKGAMGAVGYGTGAGTGGKKSLASRLM
jgi:hypothetical protein